MKSNILLWTSVVLVAGIGWPLWFGKVISSPTAIDAAVPNSALELAGLRSRIRDLENELREKTAELEAVHAAKVSRDTVPSSQVPTNGSRNAEVVTEEAWHDNGTLRSRGTSLSGVAFGLWEYWHPNGNKSEQGKWLDGKRIGRWKQWAPNGELAATGCYLGGQRIGKWTFIENGKMEDRDYGLPDSLLLGVD